MERLLVVLPNWIGDTLFATPLLRSLRAQRPDAWIATLGWPQCGEVLRHNPRVNERLTYDERGDDRGLAGAWRAVRALRARRFDAALLLRKSFSRTLVLRCAGIPTRIGFANRKSGWLLTHGVAPSTRPRHRALSYLPLLEAMGLRAEPSAYEYAVSEPEAAAARARLAALMPTAPQRLAILHVGANWPHKRWLPERFAALAEALRQDHSMQVVLSGSPRDQALVASIARRMRSPAITLAGQTTFRELAACLPCARVIVAADTGIAHIAAALRCPLVALYGPTSPALTGPLGDPTRTIVLHHADCCPRIPCDHPDHPASPGMASITVEEVVEAVATLLGQDG